MKIFIKIFLTLSFITFLGLGVFASNLDEAKIFFNNYVNAANTYSNDVPSYYSPNAVIVRQVIKPDGTLVDVPFTMAQYKNQMKISSSVAKMKKYKNNYSNITVKQINATTFQVNADRQPSLGGPKLKTYTTVQKQSNGKWLIIKEVMQTREQIFLKYAKKG